MGYYTDYFFEETDPKMDEEKAQEVLSKLAEITGYSYFESIDPFFPHLGNCKWYEHEENMRELSKLYPDYEFTLRGQGEENKDIWIKHFKDGKMYERLGSIVFPEYNNQWWKYGEGD